MVVVDSGVHSLDHFNESLYNGRYYALASRFVAEGGKDDVSSSLVVKGAQVSLVESLSSVDSQSESGPDSIFSKGNPWIINQAVVEPFMQKNLVIDRDAIPVLLPYSMAGRLIGHPVVGASVQQRVTAMQEVTRLARGFKFSQPLTGSQSVTFQIVGLLPETAIATSSSASIGEQVFSSIRAIQSGVPLIPKELLVSSTAFKQHKEDMMIMPLATPPIRQQSYIVSLPDRDAVAEYIKDHNCNSRSITCDDPGRPFAISEVNTNTTRLIEVHHVVDKIMLPFTVVVIVIACIIMAGVFGRVIADSRKEVAIFRAIGAANRQIFMIFIVYSVIVSCIIGLLAIVLGYLWACVLQLLLGSQLTEIAYISYGTTMSSLRVNLISLDTNALWWVIPVVVGVGVVSMVGTLPTLMRRSVIEDIRDES